jgi:hypothetical protein
MACNMYALRTYFFIKGATANVEGVSLLRGVLGDRGFPPGNFEIWDLPEPRKCNQIY